jgi:glutaredoxin 2
MLRTALTPRVAAVSAAGIFGGYHSFSTSQTQGHRDTLHDLSQRVSAIESDLGLNQPKYTLNVYDHCPYCLRVEVLMGHGGIRYERVVHGYGAGAPDGAPGYDRDGGPKLLTGHKMLPVLQGGNLPPLKEGYKGMPESLEVCAFIQAEHGLKIPCDAGRGDLGQWMKKYKPVHTQLYQPRILKMDIADWANPLDAEYAVWKYTTKAGFNYEEALANTDSSIAEMNAILLELEPLIRGKPEGPDGTYTLNYWGFSMDDVKLLPYLRNLSCVKGLDWPPTVKAYVEGNFARCQADTYFSQAC